MWYLYLSEPPRSHLLTALSVTSRRWASWACVKPRAFRRWVRKCPVCAKFIGTPPFVFAFSIAKKGCQHNPPLVECPALRPNCPSVILSSFQRLPGRSVTASDPCRLVQAEMRYKYSILEQTILPSKSSPLASKIYTWVNM